MEELRIVIKAVANGFVVSVPVKHHAMITGDKYTEYKDFVFTKYTDAATFIGKFFAEAKSIEAAGGVQ